MFKLTIALAIALQVFFCSFRKSPSGNACVAEALTTSLEVDSDAALVFEPSSELPPFKYASMSSFVIRPFYQNHLQL